MEKDKLNPHKAIIIGGSAGSLEVLLQLLPEMDNTISCPVIIVLHRKTAEDTILEDLIAVKATLPVAEVEDKTPLEGGSIYIAPSGYHLLVENDHTLSLDTSEKINYSRPSIDVAFESAAEVYGKSLTAILLSGANADGTHGLNAVKEKGGITIVQDPATAEIGFMPQNAIDIVYPDHILSISQILQFINSGC